jgi:hypothetical protein
MGWIVIGVVALLAFTSAKVIADKLKSGGRY